MQSKFRDGLIKVDKLMDIKSEFDPSSQNGRENVDSSKVSDDEMDEVITINEDSNTGAQTHHLMNDNHYFLKSSYLLAPFCCSF